MGRRASAERKESIEKSMRKLIAPRENFGAICGFLEVPRETLFCVVQAFCRTTTNRRGRKRGSSERWSAEQQGQQTLTRLAAAGERPCSGSMLPPANFRRKATKG